MKINTDSICISCIYFEHECGVPDGYEGCSEYCTHTNEAIKVRFDEEFEIYECFGYEKNRS